MSNSRFTIRCAVYVFLIKDEKLFMLRRKNTGWEDGKYGIPAGHLEKDELVTTGAIRELYEEAGIKAQEKNLVFNQLMQRKRKSDFDYLDVFFTLKKWRGEPKVNEPEKSDNGEWFQLDSLPENTLEHIKLAVINYKNSITYSETNL